MRTTSKLTAAGIAAVTCVIAAVLLLPTTQPADPQQRLSAAWEALDAGQFAAVRETLDLFRQDPAQRPAADLLAAALLVRGGQPHLALPALQRLDQDGPQRPRVLQLIGEALYGLRRFAEAEVFFGTLASEHPDDAEAHRWLAATYYDLGSWNSAISALTEVIRIAPDDSRPHRLLGLMHADFELTDQAVTHYRAALERDPPPEIRATIAVELAAALVSQHQYAEARRLLTDVPESPQSASLRAVCEWNLGDPQQARFWVDRAEELGATDAETIVLKSELLEAEGRHDDALRILAAAVETFPHDAALRYRYAIVLQRAGRDDASEQQFRVWETKRDLATRLTELNLRVIDDADDPELREELAEVCEQLGKQDLAAMWRAAAAACRASADAETGSRRTETSS